MYSLSKLQPNKEFDTSAAQLVFLCYYYLAHGDHDIMHHLQVVILVNITGGRAEHLTPPWPGAGAGGLSSAGGCSGRSSASSAHTIINIHAPPWP